MKGDFQAAISFIDDNILIIYFDYYKESIIEGEEIKESIKYNTNKKNKRFAGIIVPIVLVSIVCIGALIASFIILRKKNIKQGIQEESTNISFNYKK